jgi:hypothetical protein
MRRLLLAACLGAICCGYSVAQSPKALLFYHPSRTDPIEVIRVMEGRQNWPATKVIPERMRGNIFSMLAMTG